MVDPKGLRAIRALMLNHGHKNVALKLALIILGIALSLAPSRADEALLGQAIEFVREEAVSLSGTENTASEAFRYFASMSAMTLVQSRLSASRYAMRMTGEGFQPPETPEEALTRGIGLCGHHTDTFEAILSGLGIPTRRVQVFFKSVAGEYNNHIFPEVFWGGRWHMFDVTSAFTPMTTSPFGVLSYADVRSGRHYSPRISQTSDWYQSQIQQGSNPLEYLTAEKADIIIDGSGVTRPYVGSATETEISFSFATLINYVGTAAVRKGIYGNHSFEIQVPVEFQYLELIPGGKECAAGSLVIGDDVVPMPSEPVKVEVSPGPLRISIRTNEKPCYVVINKLMLKSEALDD